MSTELTVQHPGVLMTQATDVAGVCKEIVTRTAQNIQGRKYVRVEGWQSIAAAYGCVASSKEVSKVEGGVRAVGELHRVSDGALIATAEGFVGEDEPTWYGGEVMSYGKPKMLPKRPDYAIRAMAQTRAISRVCRSAFAFVVVMIDGNLSTTPAEEMTFDHEPAPQASAQPDAPLQGTENKPAGAALSSAQERLIRVKMKDAGMNEFDLERQYPAWSLTAKEGKVTLPKAEVNNVLGWIESQKQTV